MKPARTLLLLAPLAACFEGGGDTGGEACTEEARASVQITLVDTEGNPVDWAELTYSADGAAPVACEPMQDNVYVCGWEVAGSLEIAIGGDAVIDETLTVEVPADECHVVTQEITEAVELEIDA